MFELVPLPFSTTLLVVLILIAFVSGIGITTIGPGGIFLTISLYSLTTLPSSTIAGTVQVAFIATGLIGTIAYIRSGEISISNITLTTLLCAGSVAGALLGTWLNSYVSRELFGVLLGILASLTGVIILYREMGSLPAVWTIDSKTLRGKFGYGILGCVLGTFSGLLGVGGPVIAVPALVIVGVPMLYALGIAQVQSIFIAVFAASGYIWQGTVSLWLAAVLGFPLLSGVVLGWGLAHKVEPAKLKRALGAILVVIGPYLAV